MMLSEWCGPRRLLKLHIGSDSRLNAIDDEQELAKVQDEFQNHGHARPSRADFMMFQTARPAVVRTGANFERLM